MRTLVSLFSLVLVVSCSKPTAPMAPVAEPTYDPPIVESSSGISFELVGESTAEASAAGEPDIEGARAEATALGWRACESTTDCAIVRCGCSCSGCGGFSADDLVHEDHVQDWYDRAGCSEAMICPMVCCPPSELVCQQGQCTAISTATPGE